VSAEPQLPVGASRENVGSYWLKLARELAGIVALKLGSSRREVGEEESCGERRDRAPERRLPQLTTNWA
jgi:hypothetical protein